LGDVSRKVRKNFGWTSNQKKGASRIEKGVALDRGGLEVKKNKAGWGKEQKKITQSKNNGR